MSSLASHLLEIKALSLDPSFSFTWASGIKSPIYCDNRLILSYPKIRKEIIEALSSLVKKEFPHTEVFAGTATAGIPHAAFLAEKQDLPMIYVRSSAKEHGKQNKIEGRLEKNQKVLVVEDLVSTGKSSMQVVEELKNFGAEVIGVISIFTYGFEKAKKIFHDNQIKHISLLCIEDLLKEAESTASLKSEDIKKIREFIIEKGSVN